MLPEKFKIVLIGGNEEINIGGEYAGLTTILASGYLSISFTFNTQR